MTVIFNKVRDYLEGSRSAMEPGGGQLFPPADLDHIRRKVDLERKAAEDGLRDFPGPDAGMLSAVELNIKGRLEEVRDRYLADYNSMLNSYGERIDDFNDLAGLNAINTDFHALKAELETLRVNLVEGRLFNSIESLKALAREIRLFRKDHGLESRTPDVPDNQDTVWVWLALAVGGELALNFFMLREAGTAFQVVAQSLLYAIINVLLPFAFMPGQLRKFWHVHRLQRALAAAWTACYITIYCLPVNLLMAHYRGVVLEFSALELQQTAGTAGTEASGYPAQLQAYFNSQSIAWDRFVESPFGLGDIWSWFLFAGGVGLALFSISKGFANDDRYPGYGRYQRRYEKTEKSYMDLTESALVEIQGRRQKAEREIQQLSRILSDDYRRMQQIIASAGGLKGRCEDAVERLSTDFATLVQEYRGANQKNRSQSPPRYFSESVHINPPALNEFQHSGVKNPAEAIKQLRIWSDELNSLHRDLAGGIGTVQETLKADYPFEVTGPEATGPETTGPAAASPEAAT